MTVAIDLPPKLRNSSWMNKQTWGELSELAKIKPFSQANLLQHIVANRDQWAAIKNDLHSQLTFTNLPNHALLDFKFFKNSEEDFEKIEQVKLKEL